MTINISNEGWDAICFMVIFLVISIVLIVGIFRTGRWPWEDRSTSRWTVPDDGKGQWGVEDETHHN